MILLRYHMTSWYVHIGSYNAYFTSETVTGFLLLRPLLFGVLEGSSA